MAIKIRSGKKDQPRKLSRNRSIKSLLSLPLFFLCLIILNGATAQSLDFITRTDITFTSEGVILAGTLFSPTRPQAALVLVHGSGQEKRMNRFAEQVARRGFRTHLRQAWSWGVWGNLCGSRGRDQ